MSYGWRTTRFAIQECTRHFVFIALPVFAGSFGVILYLPGFAADVRRGVNISPGIGYHG
jgi:hypothetical protein